VRGLAFTISTFGGITNLFDAKNLLGWTNSLSMNRAAHSLDIFFPWRACRAISTSKATANSTTMPGRLGDICAAASSAHRAVLAAADHYAQLKQLISDNWVRPEFGPRPRTIWP
jgi:hypothetical protein